MLNGYIIDENGKDNTIVCFYDGDEGRPLGKDELVTLMFRIH